MTDEAMIDLLLDDGMLQRRLEAFADARLTPGLATSSRMRARVLAVAHRQSALTLADTSRSLLPDPDPERLGTPAPAVGPSTRPVPRRTTSLARRAMVGIAAAALLLSTVAGSAMAARAGGPLYEARVWAETLSLPSEPRARAVAELERLEDRLAEAATASASGDTAGVMAALAAYERIVTEAAAATIASDDVVASATLEAGVGRNVEILQGLVALVPDRAAAAITAAIERALARSSETIDQIHAGPATGGGDGPNGDANGPDSNSGNGANGGDGAAPTAAPTPKPTKTPKPEPTPKPTPTAKPATTPDPTAAAPTAKPTPPPKPTPQPHPTRSPRPERSPNQPPGGNRGGG
jgi:hypothetical protein